MRGFTYNDALQLTVETNALAVLTRSYDTLSRAKGVGLASGYSVGYGYDAVGRFTTLSNAVETFTYSYVVNSSLLAGVSGAGGFNVSYAFEAHRNVKTQVLNKWGATVVSQFDYTSDAVGRRTKRVDKTRGHPSHHE